MSLLLCAELFHYMCRSICSTEVQIYSSDQRQLSGILQHCQQVIFALFCRGSSAQPENLFSEPLQSLNVLLEP